MTETITYEKIRITVQTRQNRFSHGSEDPYDFSEISVFVT